MGKRILNVACGNDTYGTDFVDLYPSRPEIKRCDIDKEKLPFDDRTFDEVFCKASLHHLKNPGHALKEMARVLKYKGKLVLITDNAGCIFYHIRKTTHYGKYEDRGKNIGDRQYEIFTPWHLSNHLQATGLKVHKMNYIINEGGLKNRLHKFIYKLSGFLIGKSLSYPQILVEGTK